MRNPESLEDANEYHEDSGKYHKELVGLLSRLPLERIPEHLPSEGARIDFESLHRVNNSTDKRNLLWGCLGLETSESLRGFLKKNRKKIEAAIHRYEQGLAVNQSSHLFIISDPEAA